MKLATVPVTACASVALSVTLVATNRASCPRRLDWASLNQRVPLGPGDILRSPPFGVRPVRNSVITPLGVIRPTWLAAVSVNHKFPSAPKAMASGRLLAVGIVNSARSPVVERRPIRLPPDSANQMVLLPAGPAVIPAGVRPAVR